jgi:hypothetical protein
LYRARYHDIAVASDVLQPLACLHQDRNPRRGEIAYYCRFDEIPTPPRENDSSSASPEVPWLDHTVFVRTIVKCGVCGTIIDSDPVEAFFARRGYYDTFAPTEQPKTRAKRLCDSPTIHIATVHFTVLYLF